jgi:hypothetical protein
MAEVNLTVTADLASLRQQLGKIPGISAEAAERMTAELNKSIRASEQASKKAEAAAKKAAQEARNTAGGLKQAKDAASEFGDKADKLGGNLGKVAGLLDMVAPGAGEAARSIGDVADGANIAATAGKAMGASLSSIVAVSGAVGLALAAIAYAYSLVAKDAETANEKLEASKKASDKITGSVRQREDAELRLQRAIGGANALLADRRELELGAKRDIDDYNNELGERIAKLQEEEASEEVVAQARLENARSLENFRKIRTKTLETDLKALDVKTEAEAKAKQAADDEKKALEAKQKAIEAYEKKQKQISEAKAAREKQEREAAAEAEKQRAAAEAAAKAEQDRVKGINDAIDRLTASAKKSNESRLEGAAKIEAALADELKAIEETSIKGLKLITGGDEKAQFEREKIRAATREAELAAEAEAAAAIDEIDQKAFESRMARLNEEAKAQEEQRIANRDSVLSSSADLASGLSQTAELIADTQGKTDKEAAMRSFEVAKGLAFAEATISTALAVIKAAPDPIAMIAAGVTGGVAAAKIMSTPPPSFSDTPGVMQMASRGTVSLASGDYFAAAKSPTELRRQTGSAPVAPQILEVRLGHRTLDRSVARTIRQGGRLSREIGRMVERGGRA